MTEHSARSGRSLPRIVLSAGVVGAVVVLGVLRRSTMDAGGDSLAGADGEWLLLAAAGTVALWVACTVSLLGSVPVRLPVARVFAVQLAASFVNHLLPAGSGGIAVNVRFLRRHGVSRGSAVGAVGLNSLATGITHLALLAGVVLVAPSSVGRLSGRAPRFTWPMPHPGPAVALVAGGIAVLVTVLVTLALTLGGPRRWLGRLAARAVSAAGQMVREMAELRAVLRHPGRAAALWVGSLTLPFFHTLVLFSILQGLRVPVTLGSVMVIYLGVSSVAALIPSPGGIGGLDVALVAGLAAVGASSAVAVGAVLGYRMITVWLPLLPAAGVFAVLLRRRII